VVSAALAALDVQRSYPAALRDLASSSSSPQPAAASATASASAAVALLGLGGGGLAADLRRHCGGECGRIVAVEHSRDVIRAARDHFARDSGALSYVHADARAYLSGQPEASFDVIINDALTGGGALRPRERAAAETSGMPLHAAQLSHPHFLALAHAKLRRGGAYIVIVACPGAGPLAQPLRDTLSRLRRQFREVRAAPGAWGDGWGLRTRHHVIVAFK
jgi:SAM-dependent methyltransferase